LILFAKKEVRKIKKTTIAIAEIIEITKAETKSRTCGVFEGCSCK
jgi:hypothetical protein